MLSRRWVERSVSWRRGEKKLYNKTEQKKNNETKRRRRCRRSRRSRMNRRITMIRRWEEEEKTAAAMGSSSPAAAVAVTTAAVPPHATVSGGEGGPTERRRDARADQRWPRYLAARPRLPPSHRSGGHRHLHRHRAAATEPRRHIREPPLRARHTATVFGFRLFASVDYCCCPRCRCWCYWPLLLSSASSRAWKN